MLHEVSGDILLTRAQAIAHGVAPNDAFNQGLELGLRESWPAMYKDFRHFCQTTHPKAGGLWAWAGAEGTRVVSVFTQDAAYDHGAKPGRASVEILNHALKAFRRRLAKVCESPSALWLHVRSPGEKDALYAKRIRPATGMEP